MTAQLSREELQQIADTDHVQCGDAAAMARMLLAVMDSEPVVTDSMALAFHQAITDSSAGSDDIEEIKTGLRAALANYSAPTAPVPCTAPDGLRMALSNAGIAAPESDEVLFATREKYVQLLVDWVKDRKPFAPAPVAVPDDVLQALRKMDDEIIAELDAEESACRAAMQAEPVTAATVPDGWTANSDANAALVMLDRIDTIDCADDERIESVKSVIRRLAAAPMFGNFRENENSSTEYFRENAETSTKSPEKCWCLTCRPVSITDMRFVVCPECGNKRCPSANDHRHACTGSNEPGQEGSAYSAAPEQEV